MIPRDVREPTGVILFAVYVTWTCHFTATRLGWDDFPFPLILTIWCGALYAGCQHLDAINKNAQAMEEMGVPHEGN